MGVFIVKYTIYTPITRIFLFPLNSKKLSPVCSSLPQFVLFCLIFIQSQNLPRIHGAKSRLRFFGSSIQGDFVDHGGSQQIASSNQWPHGYYMSRESDLPAFKTFATQRRMSFFSSSWPMQSPKPLEPDVSSGFCIPNRIHRVPVRRRLRALCGSNPIAGHRGTGDPQHVGDVLARHARVDERDGLPFQGLVVKVPRPPSSPLVRGRESKRGPPEHWFP